MTIRNFTKITYAALAVAAVALAAPAAQSQTRSSNVTGAKRTSVSSGRIYRSANSNGNSGYYGNSSAGYLNTYDPYGYAPYLYGNSGYGYSQGGALVLGSNGQLYDPFAGSGSSVPTYSQGGVTVPAPVQSSDRIEAVRLAGNRIRIEWNGDPRPVANIKFSLLDRNRKPLQTAVVTDLPAQADFSLPANAAYYRVAISYGDGAVRYIVTAL